MSDIVLRPQVLHQKAASLSGSGRLKIWGPSMSSSLPCSGLRLTVLLPHSLWATACSHLARPLWRGSAALRLWRWRAVSVRIGVCFIGCVNQPPYRRVLAEGPLEPGTSLRFSSQDSPYAHVEFPRSREIELPWEERLRRTASRLVPPELFEPLTALGIQARFHPAPPSAPTVTTSYTPRATQHNLWALTELSLPSWKTYTPPTWTRTYPCLLSASVLIGAQKRIFPCGGAWVKGTASPITW